MLRLYWVLFLFVVSPFAAGCDDDKPAPGTIAEHLEADKSLSELHSILDRAELLPLLDAPGSFTVFAFRDTEESYGFSTHGVNSLANYHVVEGETSQTSLERRTAITTLNGDEIHVRFGLAGLLLNDGVKVLNESIVADNGVIHILDRPLTRPLDTSFETYESTPAALIEGSIEDIISISDEGYIHNLRVSVDIEDFDTSSMLFLEHLPSGTFLTFKTFTWAEAKPQTLKITLADSAQHDIVDDALFGSDTVFPHASYSPNVPLESLVGTSLAGDWQLTIYSFGGGDVAPTLNGWSMHVTYGAEPPAPALVLSPRMNVSTVLGRGFTERAAVRAGLVGEELAGALTISGRVGAIEVSETLPVGIQYTELLLPIPADAEVGPRTIALSAQIGAVSRTRLYQGKVVQPQSAGLTLLSHIPLPNLGALGAEGNDIWGWTDPMTGAEIAIIGTTVGTAFVDITMPSKPVVLGTLPTQSDGSVWRDIKVYQDHAYIVSEADEHGLQIFDLTLLRGLTEEQVFTATAHYSEFGNAHNIFIHEEIATAYVVATNYPGCNGGMLALDLSAPKAPVAISCFSGAVTNGQPMGPSYPTDVTTHDVQCVLYKGPDLDYQGKEICFSSDEDSIGIADYSDPENPAQIVRMIYDNIGYSHQGWLTEDHSYFITNDEFDEVELNLLTQSYVWDIRDLDAPVLAYAIENPTRAIGHDSYVQDGLLYQANYTSGLRIVDLANIASEDTPEIAFFDTYPDDDDAVCPTPPCGELDYNGAWSNYPFFASGVIVVSDTKRGLFVLQQD